MKVILVILSCLCIVSFSIGASMLTEHISKHVTDDERTIGIMAGAVAMIACFFSWGIVGYLFGFIKFEK